MARKWIALKHPIERGVDFMLRNLPRHQCAFSQIRCEQSLTDAPDCSGAQHRGNSRHNDIDTDARAARNFLEWRAHESLDFVL